MRPSELLLDYTAFNQCVKELGIMDRPTQDPLRQWLCDWQRFSLAWGPQDDKERSQQRLGHYLGWFNGIKWAKEQYDKG